MRYSDLVQKTTNLPLGKHPIAELEVGSVLIHNTGARHHYLTARDEYRLIVQTGGKVFAPRHSDFLADYVLKCECRPELRLALSEACDALCNGASPSELLTSKNLPQRFSEAASATWSFQTSAYQTGGLPTALFLHGLQGLIRVYDLNDSSLRAPEAFRQSFLELQSGAQIQAAAQRLCPQVRPGKRYFDRVTR